jgi:hypothetical protein
VASQKFTCPVVNDVGPAETVAVAVTVVPRFIDVIGAPLEVSESAVEVTVCGPTTVTGTVVLAVNPQQVPVTVIVEVPRGAALLALRVIVLVTLAGLGENEAVTPGGRADATSVTPDGNGAGDEAYRMAFPVPPW